MPAPPKHRQRGPLVSSSPVTPSGAGSRSRRAALVVRRLFDTGSFFGVGVPEAVVVTLLAWFLLGPAELFRLAKQLGNWLGELRSYVGQVAQQYETALDDESTRKAIDGIRETQRTVSEIGQQWRSVTDSLRDPLALGSTFQNTFDKYSSDGKKASMSDAKDKEAEDSKDAKSSKDAKKEDEVSVGYPDLTSEPEPVEVSPGPAAASSSVGPAHQEETTETAEELEAKRKASREAAASLWYSDAADDDEGATGTDVEGYLARVDKRLAEVDEMAVRLQELRADMVLDRNAVRASMLSKANAAAASDGEDSAGADAEPTGEPETEAATKTARSVA